MYAAAGGLSLARRQARRQMDRHQLDRRRNQLKQEAADAHGPSYKPPLKPLPPIRHRQSHQLEVQNHDELRDAQAQLLERPACSRMNDHITSIDSVDLSAEGKAAWHEKDRERRVSLTEAAVNHRIKATEAHRRWMRKNRINDSSFGGSSLNGGNYTGGVFQAANTLLYVGLGTAAFGLILSGLGTGDKGFQTYALRLMGPALFLSGVLCCLLSVLLCVCPSKCCRRCHKQRHIHKNSLKCHINHHQQQQSSEHFNHHSLLRAVKSDSKETKRTEDIAMADQTKLLQKNINGNNKKTVSIVTTPLETATVSNAPVPSGSSGYSSHHHHQKQQQHCEQHQQQIPQNVVASTLLFLQHEQRCSSFTNNAHPLQAPTINIPNFISSSSDEEDILGSTHLLEDSIRKDSKLLDLEMQHLDSDSFDFSSFGNSNDKEGILRIERDESANNSGKYCESDKRRTSLTSVCRNGGATLMTSKAVIETTATSPSSRIGLVNPDPDAHKLEEMLLLDEEFQLSSAISKDLHNSPFSVAVSSSSSPGRHSDVDNLLQSEIVLSPSKLQQAARKS